MKEIEIKNLSYSYTDKVEALNNLTLSIERGSFVSLIGRNGSGKSTLVKTLIGLLNPEGEVKIGGVSLDKDHINEVRKKVAIVFQNPDNQFVGSTVEDDIAFGLENRMYSREEMKQIVYESAKSVGMEKYLDKEPIRLSGGQKQRVAIAGALALSPEVLILDEATAMLDSKGKHEIESLLIKMRAKLKDLTIILITHDMEEVLLSDEVILLDKGNLITQCKPLDLFTNDELLNKYNLNKPFTIKLQVALKEAGINIDAKQSVDEMVEQICRLK